MIVIICLLAVCLCIVLFDLWVLSSHTDDSSRGILITPIARKIKNHILLMQRFSQKEPQRVRFISNENEVVLNIDALNYYVQYIEKITKAAFVSLRFSEISSTFPASFEHTIRQSENAFIPWLTSGATAIRKKELTTNSASFGLFERIEIEVLFIEHVLFSSGKRGVLICGFNKETQLTFEKEKEISELAGHVEEDLNVLSNMYTLLDQLKDATEAVRNKDTSLKFLSHDMKSPLHNLSLILDTLKDETTDKEIIEAGMRSLSSAQRVVEGILKPDEIEIAKTNDISDILRDLHYEFKKHAQSKGLFLELHDHLTASFNLINNDDLRRVLQNFISNAIKYTQNGGVTLTSSFIDSQVVIEISDSGVGMSEEELLQFGLLEGRYRKDLSDGDGIGAMSAMQIINKNQWKFKIESKLDSGTVVMLSILT